MKPDNQNRYHTHRTIAKHKSCAPPKRKSYRVLLRVFSILAVVFITLLLIAHYTVFYRPATYHPVILNQTRQQQSEDKLLAKYNELYNKVHEMSDFQIAISQNLLNELLLNDKVSALLARISTPELKIQNPQLSINTNRLTLMGTINYKRISFVLSAIFSIKMVNKSLLRIDLQGFKAGNVSINYNTLKDNLLSAIKLAKSQQLKTIKYKNAINATNNSNNQRLQKELWNGLTMLTRQGYLEIKPVFQVVEDKKMRIKSLRIKAGWVVLDVHPELIKR